MRKILLLILLLTLSFNFVCVATATEETTPPTGTKAGVPISVSEPSFALILEDETKRPIQEPQQGNVETTVTVTNYDDEQSYDATLVVAVLNKNTGKIHGIDIEQVEVEQGETKDLSAAVVLPDTEIYTYRYMVWEDFDNMIALGNSAPLKPENFCAVTNYSTVLLSWEEAEDDVGVLEYEIYRGEALIKRTTECEYLDKDLSDGTPYVYKIVASDAGGLKSSESDVLNVTTKKIYTIDMSGATMSDGTALSETEDYGYTVDTSQSGYVGLKNSNTLPIQMMGASTGSGQYTYIAPNNWDAPDAVRTSKTFTFTKVEGVDCLGLYNVTSGLGMRFEINSDFFSENSGNVTVRPATIFVRYKDTGTGKIALRYKTPNPDNPGEYAWAQQDIELENSGEWKTYAHDIDDLYVGDGTDFNIRTSGTACDIYISEVGFAERELPEAEQ